MISLFFLMCHAPPRARTSTGTRAPTRIIPNLGSPDWFFRRPVSGQTLNALFSFVSQPFSSYFIPKWSPKHVESRYTTFKLQKQLNRTGKIQAKLAKIKPRDPDVQILQTKHSELPWDLTKLTISLEFPETQHFTCAWTVTKNGGFGFTWNRRFHALKLAPINSKHHEDEDSYLVYFDPLNFGGFWVWPYNMGVRERVSRWRRERELRDRERVRV